MWLISIYALNFGIKWLKLRIFGWKYHWKYITIYGTLKRICSILFIKARSFMLSEFLIKLYVFSCSEDSLGAKIIETITWVGDSYVEFCERLIMELTPWIYSLLLRFYYLWNSWISIFVLVMILSHGYQISFFVHVWYFCSSRILYVPICESSLFCSIFPFYTLWKYGKTSSQLRDITEGTASLTQSFINFPYEGHREPRNKVRSLSPGKRPVICERGTFRFYHNTIIN